MKNLYRAAATMLLMLAMPGEWNAQFNFTNGNAKLNTPGFHSGCPVTVTDWNFDGLDDIVRLSEGNSVYVEIQRTNQTYETRFLGAMSSTSGWAWGMCVADVDHNGYKDIVAGGYGPALKICTVSDDGLTGTITNIPNSNFFLQNASFGDFNNDGWADLFACDDNGPSSIFINDGTGNLLESSIINFTINPGTIGNNDPRDSGNYGSVVTDFDNDGDLDLYIAKCRQSSSVSDGSDPRRVNVMFVNNGDGTYTENAAEYGINVAWQSWTASFGDIDNDADFDLLLTNHDHQTQIFQNNGSGYYTEITATTGVNVNLMPLQSGFEDLDNDGFIDLVITGDGHRFYHNNGDGTFTLVSGLFPSSISSFAFGDLNHDGKIDLYTSYHSGYTTPSNEDDIVWFNTVENNNHFITLDLRGTESNHGAIGARALIYGSWGVQIREARAGESYGTVSTQHLHFGLGQSTEIDSIVVKWPSGNTQTILNPAIDQFLTITENSCVSPEALVTLSGPAVFCAGQTLTLTAPAGYTYLWSDGETTQSLNVTSSGEYNVRITEIGNNCSAVSKTINVIESPDETPEITALSETSFCNGGSVIISGPPDLPAYEWSNGLTTQTITVTDPGDYFLTIQGACQEFSSTPITVNVITPEAPVAEDVVLPAAGTATLTATGNNPIWYSDAAGTNIIGTGSSIETPVVETETTFYVSTSIEQGGDLFSAGLTAHSGSSVYSGSNSTNASMIFDVLENCTLRSVKVGADIAGNRTIEVRDNAGALVHSATFNVQVGDQVLDLNFELTPGTDYTMSTSTATNQASLGFAGPRLKRNYAGNGGTPYAYPFNADNLLSITNTSAGELYFFYFYDWKVESPIYACYSDPVAVTVSVDTSTGIEEVNGAIRVFPNPADAFVTIQTTDAQAQVALFDAAGRMVKRQRVGLSEQVQVNDLDAGVYMVQIQTLQGVLTKKLIVQ